MGKKSEMNRENMEQYDGPWRDFANRIRIVESHNDLEKTEIYGSMARMAESVNKRGMTEQAGMFWQADWSCGINFKIFSK